MDPMEEDDEETESLCDSPLEADIISTGDQILDTSHASADMVNGGNGMRKTNGFAAGVGPAMGDSSDTDTDEGSVIKQHRERKQKMVSV